MSYKSECEGSKRGRTVKTAEEIAARRIARIERSRKYREQKKATETPEQAAERCAKRAEHLRKMRAIRTAEKRAKRTKQLMKTLAMVTLEKFALETEELEQSIETETAVQKNNLLLQETEFKVGDRHLTGIQEQQEQQESRRQRTFTQNLEILSDTQDGEENLWGQDDLQDDSTDPESSNIEEQDPKRRTTIKDALHCIQMLLDASKSRDEHSIYGDYIAEKIRTCNRDSFEINIAQHHIENIIFKLCMGGYREGGVDAANNIEKQNMSASSCFQPLVIPKIEPDM